MKRNINDLTELEQNLMQETAKVNWHEIERFFATGAMITVDKSLDLIQTAAALHDDNSVQVKQWMEQSLVINTSDDDALKWQKGKNELWAVVVKPWILVQEIAD